MTELKKWEDLYAGFDNKNTRVAKYVERKIAALKRPAKSAAMTRRSSPNGGKRKKQKHRRTHKRHSKRHLRARKSRRTRRSRKSKRSKKGGVGGVPCQRVKMPGHWTVTKIEPGPQGQAGKAGVGCPSKQNCIVTDPNDQPSDCALDGAKRLPGQVISGTCMAKEDHGLSCSSF